MKRQFFSLLIPICSLARDVGRHDLWAILPALQSEMGFTFNDSIIVAALSPESAGNLTLAPTHVSEPLFPDAQIPTGALRADSPGRFSLRRGPLIALNRSVERCSSSGQWEEACGGEEGLPFCREVGPHSMWDAPNLRVPVDSILSWLRHDTEEQYCWSIVQSQPDFLTLMRREELLDIAGHVFVRDDPSHKVTFTREQYGVPLTCAAGSALCVGVDTSSPHYLSLLAVPRDAHADVFSPSPRPSSFSLFSTPSDSTPAAPTCIAGSARIRFTEWSFPRANFSVMARLALDDDAWVRSARRLAVAEHVEDAAKPVDSGYQVPFRDIVPGKINFTETARDQPVYWAWANDSHWMRQTVVRVFGTVLWETRARYYPDPRPTLHQFVARFRGNASGDGISSLSPLKWTLVHWHPGWIDHDTELIRRGSIGVAPPITSYVMTPRPPSNLLHLALGDTWGTLVFIAVSLVTVLLLAGVQCCLERKKAKSRGGSFLLSA